MNQETRDLKRQNRKSKHQRRGSTKARESLAKILKHHSSGYKFIAQPPLENVIPDFHCAKIQLAILIDGTDQDNKRVKTLKRQGIRVLKYSSADIIEFPDMIDIDIANEVDVCENKSE